MAVSPLSGPGPVELHFRAGDVRMDRDFELEWTPEQGTAPQAAAFVDTRAEGTFVQLMLLPPRIEESVIRLGREFIIVLDSSGSMEGNSIVQAKQSVEVALDRLRDGDWFNIVDFDSGYRTLFSASAPATPANIEQARRFVQGLQADGGTEMLPALQFALTAPPVETSGESLLKQIVFITDGSVGNEQQLFALIRAELADARLFTVGIGSAPNSYFMREAAESGRGTYVHIQDTAQVTQRMDTLLRKLENAVMTDLAITWPTGVTAEYYPSTIPDLYLGEPLFVTARVAGNIPPRPEIRIAGAIAGRQWERSIEVDTTDTAGSSAGEPVSRSSLASYWARQKMEALLDAALSQGSNDEVARAQLRNAVLAVALPYQLMSPYTSFVAVENRISRPPQRSLNSGAVANSPPAGQVLAAQLAAMPGMQQVVYPATATAADLLIASAIVALVFALLLRWPRRRGDRYARR
jgi:Ca-activated chloride channel family protein